MIEYLERQIEKCDELGGMELEKWAFIQCLKEFKQRLKAGQHETIVIGMNDFIEERIKFWEKYGDNDSYQIRELKVIRKKLKEYQ